MTPTDRPDSERDSFRALLNQLARACGFGDDVDARTQAADAVLAAFDAARTPLDQPEAVAWMRVDAVTGERTMKPITGVKPNAAEHSHALGMFGERIVALGVLPFAASTDRVRREALELAAADFRLASACVSNAADRTRAHARSRDAASKRELIAEAAELTRLAAILATKGQS